MMEIESDEVDIKPNLPSLRIDIPSSAQSWGDQSPHLILLSPPLREVSPDVPVSPPEVLQTVKEEAPSGTTRFAAKTEEGGKQCTNCGETDTPQWRGTLCNACALWRRSRGTDRPLPLLFPIRKRLHSVSPEEGDRCDDGEEADGRIAGEEGRRRRNMMYWRNEDESPLKVYERRIQFGTNAKCTICGEGAAVSVRWALCGGCLRNGRANTPRHPMRPLPLLRPAHAQHDSQGSRMSHPSPNYGNPQTYTSTANPHSIRIGNPQLSSATRTPISPQAVSPHLPNDQVHHEMRQCLRPPDDGSNAMSPAAGGIGRRRSATVSSNVQADSLAHPDTSIHSPENAECPHHSYAVSLSPPDVGFSHTSAFSTARDIPERSRSNISCQSSSNETPRVFIGIPRPDDREATVERPMPTDDVSMPSRIEFMESAEWIWGVMKRTENLLS